MPNRDPSRSADRSESSDSLRHFRPWVAEWFRRAVGEPTAPQRAAWPVIAGGGHVLIHSPTGSGKTFAAFLWALNELFTTGLAARDPGQRGAGGAGPRGVRILYVSPLKALNNDIERNLSAPLSGIRDFAASKGIDLPEVRAAVRTGDTPASARAAMLRRPPDILITTPESLYLILTSPRARNVLRTVRTVIIDEIHTVCGSKRGVHLALSLERLELLSPGFQRIGLSATQRPLEEVARFLGGQSTSGESAAVSTTPRRVSIVNPEYARGIELEVLGLPARQSTGAAAPSIWQGIIPRLLDDIRRHETTLVFCNGRRQAERTANRLNAQAALEREQSSPSRAAGLELGGGMFGSARGDDGPFRAHHGSLSNAQRRQLERDLKAGRLPALIGTSSLELGIDIGSVDLVVQIQSPKSVIQGLQRVGRSGHMVGQISRGRIYPTHHEDLIEAAVVARGMTRGQVEEIRTPRNSLDILAQQVAAAVAVDDWRVDDLFKLVKGAYPYADLSYESFRGVLKLLSGKYPRQLFRSLRARVYWDEANGTLSALPGTRWQATTNGGAIVDTGQFAVYLPGAKSRLGELDEEFVWETRPGDVFMLGSQLWRALEIQDDRVIVEPAPGATPRMPFWRGDLPWRPYELSRRLAAFRAELARRLQPYVDCDDDPPQVLEWLRDGYCLDEAGARQIVGYVRRQLRATGAVSSTDAVIVETFQDPVGDRRMVIHSPFGGRVNTAWTVALAAALRDRTGVEPEAQVGDDGILLRFPEADGKLPVDVVSSMTAGEARRKLLDGLADTALFGALFRQNAARALLLPGRGRGKRTPFWLQRLKAKDLLSIARQFPDFPVLLETYRDCIEDEMDLPALEEVLRGIESGAIRVVPVETRHPSPVARSLSFGFTSFYIYEWDAPKAERALHSLNVDTAALAALFRDPSAAGLLRPEAVREVVGSAGRTAPGARARTPVELALLIEQLGDLDEEEAARRCDGDAAAWLADLAVQNRVRRLRVRGPDATATRWVALSRYSQYRAALRTREPGDPALEAAASVVGSYLARRGPTTVKDVQDRYGLPAAVAEAALDALAADGVALRGYFTPGAGEREWIDQRNLSRIQARTLGILRSEIRPVSQLRYLWEVLRLQGVAHRPRASGEESLRRVLETLRGLALPIEEWVEDIFPARLAGFSLVLLDRLFASGEFVWVASSDEPARVRIFPRGTGNLLLSDRELEALAREPEGLSPDAAAVWEFIRSEGVATSSDLRGAMPRMSLRALRGAVRELVARGIVTGDSWSALVALTVDVPEGAPSRSRAGLTGRAGRLSRSELRRQAARRVREATTALPPDARWSAVQRYAVLGRPADDSARAQARADALLARYGVVSRNATDAERHDWEWEPIASVLSLQELRGGVRRGYFVTGLPGLQFAAASGVERLREDPARSEGAAVALIGARDPANVLDRSSLDLDEERDAALLKFARVRATYLAFAAARPVLLAEDRGERITAAGDLARDGRVERAVVALRQRLLGAGRASRRLTVRLWNGSRVEDSPAMEMLSRLGFRKDFPGMTYDALQARTASRR